MDIVELYVIIDDFCKKFMPKYLNLLKNNDLVSRNRNGMLNTSEIILIILLFTQSGFIPMSLQPNIKVILPNYPVIIVLLS